jgi:hypothetical protein
LCFNPGSAAAGGCWSARVRSCYGQACWHPRLSTVCCLRTFRTDLSACFARRRDALFELTDAAWTAGLVPSLVHLSLEMPHRRGWGSLSAALAAGRIDAPALRALVARHPLAGGAPVSAIDTSVWPRCDAETSPERGFYYHPSIIPPA